MTEILLPWPSGDLSPNARVHYMARARSVKKHREWAMLATRAAGVAIGHDGPGGLMLPDYITILITAYPPSRRRTDADGVISRCKAYFDGIADALEVDDSRFIPRFQWGEPVKGGKIVFSILEGAQ